MQKLDYKKILIADDDKEIRDFFMMVASSDLPNCRVDLAVNGCEVVVAFRSAYYGIIVLDVMMPKMDGEEAFKEVLEICRLEEIEIPAFIFCTGFEVSETLKAIIASDPRHCVLKKPVDNTDLIAAINDRLPS